MLTAYIGRANVTRLSLQELQPTAVPIAPGAITRVIVTLVPKQAKTKFCLDTDTTPSTIELVDANTSVDVQFGLIEDLLPGDYGVYFTVFDGSTPNGLAWGPTKDRSGQFMTEAAFILRVIRWPSC